MHIRLTILICSVFILLSACSREPDQTPAPTDTPPNDQTGVAIVDELEIQVLAGPEPGFQAVVRGHLTNTCTRITGADSEVSGREISIDVDTAPLENVNCIEETIDFVRVIPLSEEALDAGEYSVSAGPLDESLVVTDGAGPAADEPAITPPTAPGTSAITGLLWHDECINQTAGSPERTGCIESSGIFIADGTRGTGEVGIEGVRVDLGEGACPSIGLGTAVTSADGRFEFSGLGTGTYCVSVNPAIPDNLVPLGDGVWTASAGDGGSVTVELNGTDPSSEIMLGWDFLNLPEFVSAEEPEPDCIPRAAYYGDLTIPDNTVLEPGEVFLKKWRIRNEGTCTWGPGYQVIFGHGDRMGGSPTPLPVAEPGVIVEVGVELTAPEESGYYRGNWGFVDPHGKQFSVGAAGTTPIWVQIVVSFYSGTSSTPTTASPTCGEELNDEFITQLLDMVNTERAKRNLLPLELQEQLSAAAQAHSSDMACNDFLRHTGSDDSTYRQRVLDQGYTGFSYLTENIYAGNPSYGGTPEGAIEWWMNSQVHRDAILHPTVTEIGIGYAFFQESNYGAYYTLLFADPSG